MDSLRRVKLAAAVRIVGVAAGAALVLLGLGAGRLLGGAGGVRPMWLLYGLIALAFALSAPRALRIYRIAAMVVLTSLLLVVLLRSPAELAIRLMRFRATPQPRTLPYYTSRPWGEEYWSELWRSNRRKQYEPFFIWKRTPYSSRTINVDDRGVRATPGADCSAGSLRVFALGGSTLWGYGAPDWGTIPAYLQRGLTDRRAGPVCVVNYGEGGFVSTQSLLRLVAELQAGNVPDLVITYDGVNEVHTAVLYGRAGVHFGIDYIGPRVEGKGNSFTEMLGNLKRLIGVLKSGTGWRPKAAYAQIGIEPDSLATDVVGTYRANVEVIRGLSERYGFEYYPFWQPVIWVGRKRLTPWETAWAEFWDPTWARLYMAVYAQIEQVAREQDDLFYMGHVFDAQDSLVWIDWNHVTPDGNRLVADEMLVAIDERR